MNTSSEHTGATEGTPRGTETVLVVEDEASLRTMVRIVLTRAGYKVFDAPSGAEALQMWEKIGSEVDLLFTDMVMPDGLTGRELAEELQKKRPNLRVLFTSGYSTKMLMRDGRLPNGAACLQKPYLPQALAAAVSTVLSESPVSVAA